MNKLSRREALRGTGVAALAAVGVGGAMLAVSGGYAVGADDLGDDAELIRLGAEFERLRDVERPLWQACEASTEDEAEAYFERGRKPSQGCAHDGHPHASRQQ